MVNVFYKQCFLRKQLSFKPEIFSQQVAWIPEVYAHKGGYVELKGDNGWEVVAVDSIRRPEDEIVKHSQDYKHQRKASDI